MLGGIKQWVMVDFRQRRMEAIRLVIQMADNRESVVLPIMHDACTDRYVNSIRYVTVLVPDVLNARRGTD